MLTRESPLFSVGSWPLPQLLGVLFDRGVYPSSTSDARSGDRLRRTQLYRAAKAWVGVDQLGANAWTIRAGIQQAKSNSKAH